MKDAQLIPGLMVIAAIALGVCYVVARSVLREMNGMGDEDESHADRRKEEKAMLKALEKWREGR